MKTSTQPSTDAPRPWSTGHAVVIGASLAGLVAAKVLSERFHRVTVLDRDVLPTEMVSRKGVPQGRHGHGLLASGFAALEQLFPGLERELVDAGAVPGDVIGDVRWFQHGYYKAQFQAGLHGVLLSRPLLEGTLRQMVRQLPNVTIVDDTHALSLVADVAGRRVTGVRIRQGLRDARIDGAALVIDASGRASRAAEWLERLGYDAAPEARVEVGLRLHDTYVQTAPRRSRWRHGGAHRADPSASAPRRLHAGAGRGAVDRVDRRLAGRSRAGRCRGLRGVRPQPRAPGHLRRHQDRPNR